MNLCSDSIGSLLSARPRSAVLSLALLGALGLAGARCAASPWPDEVPNFSMLDLKGRYYEFHRVDSRVLVLFFTENGCPASRQNLRKLSAIRDEFPDNDLAIWAVDANPSDTRESIYNEAEKMDLRHVFPFLRDDSQGVAQMLGVTRTATVVALSTADSHVFYHGALDDQPTEGASKPGAAEEYLENALRAFLTGQPVKQATTAAPGRLIHLDPKLTSAEVSYTRDVAPILEKHCIPCHSPGNIGPFAFASYAKVKSKADMIQEVLLSRRMPPWSADPEIGHYRGERTLTLDETRTLLGWIAHGSPRGEGADPLPGFKIPLLPEWPLGTPDFVVKLPRPEQIPATGVLEYRHIKIKAPITEDTWLGAVDVKPGNRSVLHHCIVREQTPKGDDDSAGFGKWLQAWVPGIQSVRFPKGTGRLLPKGATINLELHYTTTGSAQSDETEVGFYKLPGRPQLVLRNLEVMNPDFSIPPAVPDAATFAIVSFPRDTMLYALSPHMHLRGSWMCFQVLFPFGRPEMLLSVPHYDFNWQTTYRFLTPKLLPAGSWILCTGGFDNSSKNPSNPAPGKRVTWGSQSFNEMFIGFMETAELPKPAEGAPAASPP